MQVSEIFSSGQNWTGGHNDRDRDDRNRHRHHRGHFQRCWNWRRFCWENRWNWDD